MAPGGQFSAAGDPASPRIEPRVRVDSAAPEQTQARVVLPTPYAVRSDASIRRNDCRSGSESATERIHRGTEWRCERGRVRSLIADREAARASQRTVGPGRVPVPIAYEGHFKQQASCAGVFVRPTRRDHAAQCGNGARTVRRLSTFTTANGDPVDGVVIDIIEGDRAVFNGRDQVDLQELSETGEAAREIDELIVEIQTDEGD